MSALQIVHNMFNNKGFHYMNTFSPYISIVRDGEDFEAESVFIFNENADDKDWQMRKLLHTIFSNFRNGDRVSTAVICNDDEEMFIAESYFWEESLALLGPRDVVKAFKKKVDELPKEFWDAIFSKENEMEKSSDTPFLDAPWNGYIDELLALCDIGNYANWISCFRFKPEDYSSINDFYCLCVLSTYMGRTPHWTDSHWDNQRILSLIKAMDKMYHFNPYRRFIRTVEELHRMGYERIRICPSTSPTGLAWRCAITTKANTSKRCGAMLSSEKNKDLVFLSNGSFPWEMMSKSPYDNALKFIKSFPTIAEKGKGLDEKYASWFKKVVRECFHFQLPTAYGDYYHCWEEGKMRLMGFGHTNRTLTLSPAGEGDGLDY